MTLTSLTAAETALVGAGTDMTPWLVGGAIALLLAGGGLLFALRRRGNDDAAEPDPVKTGE